MTSTATAIEKTDTVKLIEQRHAKRSFHSDRPVDPSIVATVLRAAAEGAPSTQHTQPWGVSVITGRRLHALRDEMLARYDRNEIGSPEYANRPENPTLEEFDRRIAAWGAEFYAVKNLDRHDAKGRWLHTRDNYTLFGAPMLCLFHIPERAVAGTFLDMGFFLQNVMIGLLSYGLGSCPMYSLCRYSNLFREYCTEDPLLPAGRMLVCGMTIGYVNTDDAVNSFQPERDPLDSFAKFFTDDSEEPGSEEEVEVAAAT